MAEEQAKYASPEEEISELERRLEAKKRELGMEGKSLPAEKEVLREVLKEHIEEVIRAEKSRAAPPVVTPSSAVSKKTDDLVKKEEEREKEIFSLIEVALTRGIRQAVKMALSESPHILDELHDRLVDDYYDKLVALGKIKSL